MKRSGFTMIELLVTVVIVGVLMTAGVVSYRNSTSKARDSKRISHLEQIRSALEMYRADVGQYPDQAGVDTTLEAGYIDAWPVGPQADTYIYTPVDDVSGNHVGYTLEAYLEDASQTGTCTESSNCSFDACNYCLKNP